jgi:phage tail protein X
LFICNIVYSINIRWNEVWKDNPPFPYSVDPYNVTLQYSNAIEHFNITINPRSKIYMLFHSLDMDEEYLYVVIDRIVYNVYGRTLYCPTRLHATMEDYYTTRYDVIDYLQQRYKYKTYLEIGCDANQTFGHVGSFFDTSICVDPVKGGTHRMTSDDFFANNNQTFDVIFVDGLHEARQVLRDVYHALRYLNDGGTIVLHDANPHHSSQQQPDMSKSDIFGWCGDVWKAIVALRLQEGLEIVVGDFNNGVGLIRRRRNLHKLPMEWEDRLLYDPISVLDYDEHLIENREILLRLMSIQDVRDWLDEELILGNDNTRSNQNSCIST